MMRTLSLILMMFLLGGLVMAQDPTTDKSIPACVMK